MLLASEGCTSELIIPDTEGSGGAAGERDASASGGGLIINMDALDFTPVNVANCGNGSLDKGESCDDRNTFEGDGCSRLCQLEADFDCPEAGRPCILRAVCGDGKLASTETCDDGEQEDGDGCSAKCTTIEAGWQCRVPGKRCVPLCGDGKITATEKCDDGNALSGDGCSSTCHVEPGYTCGAPNTPCTKSVCGNSKTELGELCDDGDKNGLFYGDGKGCSKTCTKEPNCRDSSGRNQACTTSCGDGNLDPGEPCDDGNLVSGDGCSQDCQREAGFSCTPRTLQDASPCQSGIGECLQLPIVYRDFQPENVTPGGHPDFYFLGTKSSSGAIKTWCVPNSGGPAWGNDSTARCWDIAAPDLLNGKPQYNPARADNMCACQFSDWSRKGNGGHVPNYADSESPLWDPAQRPPDFRADMTSWTANGGPIWKGKVPIVKDKKSFDQWFNDDSTVNKTFTAVLELASIGTNTYRYSSVSHLTQGGFFPLNTLNPSQATLCNLWPYWHNWPGCTGDQYLFPPRVVQADCPFQVPLTNGCWVTGLTGVKNDSYFTTEARYYFAYDGTTGLTLQFFGDDDLFIFINGKLVLDLGGVHQQTPGRVTVMGDPGVADVVEGGCLDAFGDITTTQAGYQAAGCTPTNSTPPAPVSPADFRIRTVPLGLKTGVVYEIAIFGADRHPPESNYQLTLNGFTTKRSDCEPRCGDGIVSGGEECDDGDKNNDTVYGGCTTECKFGPFCGDEVTNGPEECDLGRGNGASYGLDGCTWACMKPHFCGDGVVDTTRGESCDLGPANGTSGSRCTTKCRLIVD